MFSTPRIIEKKRDGLELTPEEIKYFISGLMTGEVADYQASAFLMAVYFQGMSLNETVALTRAMVDSGVRYDLSKIPGVKVDKHSTGGVGDKVSLILAPLASACGLKVPMMSGRGLGHSGGTLDKLESISGFDVNLEQPEFERVLKDVGCAMIGQSLQIAPADKKLYALRDVTGTVECIPLIVASILSKKIAEGTDGLVIDVKVGSGAFMKKNQSARMLAKTLVLVGKKLGLHCRAVLSNMDQPLGYSVGHSLEVLECIEILKNQKPGKILCLGEVNSSDLKELTVQLCAQMLTLGKITKTLADGRKLCLQKLSDGSAWTIFQNLVREQGGKSQQIEEPKSLPLSTKVLKWGARKSGYITHIDAQAIGHILQELGGGRKKVSDSIDPGVGFLFHKKLGSQIKAGDPIATVFVAEKGDLKELENRFLDSIPVSKTRKPLPKLMLNGDIK